MYYSITMLLKLRESDSVGVNQAAGDWICDGSANHCEIAIEVMQ